MAIELVCSCGQVLQLARRPSGESTRCPACGALLTVHETSQTCAAAPETSAAQPAAPAARKALWALMGKSAAPAAPPAAPEDRAPALNLSAQPVAPGRQPEAADFALSIPSDSTGTSDSKAPASAPVRKGLWGLMQSTPAAPAQAAAAQSPVLTPSAALSSAEAVVPPPAPTEIDTSDRDLAAIIGIPPDSVALPAQHHAAAIPQGNSLKGMIALGLGGLSIPLSFLSLIDVFWSKFPATLVGFAGILLGMQALSEIHHSAGRQTGRKLVIAGILSGVVGVFLGPLILAGIGRRMWQASVRSVTEGHLGTIGQGLNRYHDREGAFPSGGVFKAWKGQRQRGFHGWMTLLLPYVGEETLYQQIDLDVPFDDKANLPVFGENVETFFAAGADRSLVQRVFAPSHFAGVGGDVETADGDVAHAGLFGVNSKVARDDVTDGLTNTLAAGEIADNFPPWGDPENWRTIGKGINRDSQGFGAHDRTGACFLMADGSVRYFSNKTSARVMTALSTRDGGEGAEK
jgi:hypothetical protein